MKIISTNIPDVKIIYPKVFGDERGFFFESYNKRGFNSLLEEEVEFVQDNHSRSTKNVLRGLHYQINHPQGKLIRVILGEVYDVAVDLRKESPTYGKWVGIHLKAKEHQMVWIPPGFAHGFLTLTDVAEFLYKTTDYYDPQSEKTLQWNDPDLAIDWPAGFEPILSEKDKLGHQFIQR